MMTTRPILTVNILNQYKSRFPLGFYSLIRGHTGEDYNFINENLISPITGKVVAVTNQTEMGRCIYIQDIRGSIHIFAHLKSIFIKIGDKVKRNDLIAVTGNTGRKSTDAHLHYEIITRTPVNTEDKKMTRKLYSFIGYNTRPSTYLKVIYKEFGIGNNGQDLKK